MHNVEAAWPMVPDGRGRLAAQKIIGESLQSGACTHTNQPQSISHYALLCMSHTAVVANRSAPSTA